MFAKIAYYVVVLPLSYLPLSILYLFTDFFYLLIVTVAPYRKKVIEGNIARSFPNKSEKERRRIKRLFYRHFTDLLAEGIKNLTISERSIRKRMTVANPEVMDQLFESKKNVLLVSGHYNNWEWLVSSQDLLFKHKAIGIGMPMTSTFWDKKINEATLALWHDSGSCKKTIREELNKRVAETKAVLYCLINLLEIPLRVIGWNFFINKRQYCLVQN